MGGARPAHSSTLCSPHPGKHPARKTPCPSPRAAHAVHLGAGPKHHHQYPTTTTALAIASHQPAHNPCSAAHVVHLEAKRVLPISKKMVDLGRQGITDLRGRIANVTRKQNQAVAVVRAAGPPPTPTPTTTPHPQPTSTPTPTPILLPTQLHFTRPAPST